MDRSELTDTLLQGEGLGSPMGTRRPATVAVFGSAVPDDGGR